MVRTLMRQRGWDYVDLADACGRQRSNTWWENLLEYGPWKGPGSIRTDPPDSEAIVAFAEVFDITTEQVAAMVAADWYGLTSAPLRR